jgi:hypothetical protein
MPYAEKRIPRWIYKAGKSGADEGFELLDDDAA